MERLKKLNVDKFYTDHWDVYSKLIPADKLKQSKSETVAIERNNSRQRHWFARFRRKSIVVSKSLEMVDLTMSLFARFHVNGKNHIIIWLILSNFLRPSINLWSVKASLFPHSQSMSRPVCLDIAFQIQSLFF